MGDRLPEKRRIYLPFFRRPDGFRLRDLPPIRQAMPLVLKRRHEAAIYHKITLDLTRTLEWLNDYSASHPAQKATFFHLYLWASARNLHAFPHLNRFAVGRHVYQRSSVTISFSVKKERSVDAPFVLTKLDMASDEAFAAVVDRATAAAEQCRHEAGGLVDLELMLVEKLPTLVTGTVVDLMRLADRLNILPGSMIEGDPLFTSLILGNLGSVGLDAPFHHLNDYGSCSLFGTIGLIERRPVVVGEKVEVRPVVDVGYTMDERAFDGYYAARAIEHLRRLCEDPGAHISP